MYLSPVIEHKRRADSRANSDSAQLTVAVQCHVVKNTARRQRDAVMIDLDRLPWFGEPHQGWEIPRHRGGT